MPKLMFLPAPCPPLSSFQASILWKKGGGIFVSVGSQMTYGDFIVVF